MPAPPDLTREILEKDLSELDTKNIIKRGERTVCINPYCFDDACQGECEDENYDCGCNPDCGCDSTKGK